MEHLLLRARVVVKPTNMKTTSSFRRRRQQILPKSVPHVQHDYFSSLIQPIILLFSVGIVVDNLPLAFHKLLNVYVEDKHRKQTIGNIKVNVHFSVLLTF